MWDVERRHGKDARIAKYLVKVCCKDNPALKHDVVGYLADAGFEAVVWSMLVVSFSMVAGSGNGNGVDEHGVSYCESFLTAASDDVAVLDRGPVDDANVDDVH